MGCSLLILGAAGDLTARPLLPGLGTLVAEGGAGDLLLVGSGREDLDDRGWRERVERSFAEAGAEGPEAARVVERARYHRRTRRARLICGSC